MTGGGNALSLPKPITSDKGITVEIRTRSGSRSLGLYEYFARQNA